jgi:hypothetical protein
MAEDWRIEFDRILKESAEIREVCFNRTDPRVTAWTNRVRECLRRYAPVKIPALDEIRFASDFFLSKPPAEQDAINDRIALASDIDETEQLLRNIRNRLAKEVRHAPIPLRPRATETPQSLAEQGRRLLDTLPFSPRDREDALSEIRRAEAELAKADPNWDTLKRTIKYLLDLDRALALELVPAILQRLPKNK